MKVKVNCPYCEHEGSVTHEPSLFARRLVTCELEEGGCDRDFVVSLKTRIETTVQVIAGETERVS